MTKKSDKGQSAIEADLERAIRYYQRMIDAAEAQRSTLTDSLSIADIDRQQAMRRTSLERLQAELDRMRSGAGEAVLS